MKLKNLVLAIPFLFCILLLSAQNESDFYAETWNNGITKNLVTDYGVDPNDELDDSPLLQKAIDEVSLSSNGGKIIIPKGEYTFSNIVVKSNVHLVINHEVIIRPPLGGGFVFKVGFKSALVKNVSIRGEGGMFTMDFRDVEGIESTTAVNCQNVNNFLIANVLVLDKSTKHSALRFNLANYQNEYQYAENGVVRNVENLNAHVGYGTVQVNAGKHILFRDIRGSGGVQLRLETGANTITPLMMEGSIFDIYGRNISGSNGNAVVMISPHAIHNGKVDIDSVHSVSSVHAVRIDIGDTKNGDTPGYFSDDSKVSNVHGVYGTTAQLKYGHFRWIPCSLRHLISKTKNEDGDSFYGPAAAAMRNQAIGEGVGRYNVNVSNVTQSGFVEQTKTIQYEEDAIIKCSNVSSTNRHSQNQNDFHIFPNPINPSEVSIKVNWPINEEIEMEIFDITGKRILQKQLIHLISNTQIIKLNSSNINFGKMGVYIMRLKIDDRFYQKRFSII